MITHIVLLWLKDEHAEKRGELLKAAAPLAAIPGVSEFRAGVAIPSERAVVDDTFAVGLSMNFEDQAAAEIYQNHPLHQAFVENCVKPLTSRVLVYDFGCEA